MKNTVNRALQANTKQNQGFTIIEVLVAMSILALFIMAFSALFVQSYSGIFNAGHKSKASYNAQADVEQRLAEKNADTAKTLNIQFGSAPVITINGGNVSSTKTESGQSSSMDSFLALVPTIKIKPYLNGDGSKKEIDIYEGYTVPQPIAVIGSDTHFSGSSVLYVKDNNGVSVAGCTFHVDSTTSASIQLVGNLKSSLSPYLVSIRTGTENVSAKLSIKPPVKYVSVGEGANIAIATDLSKWVWEPWGTISNFNCITYYNNQFVAAGKNGKVMYSKDGHIWTSVNLPSSTVDFNGIAYGNGTSVVAGTEGTIYTAVDSDSKNLALINAVTTTGEITAFNAVAYGLINSINNKFVAVGTKGTVYVSSTGTNNWSRVNVPGVTDAPNLPDLNDVTFGDIEGQNWFVAVGNNGTILLSLDGDSWSGVTAIADNTGGQTPAPALQFNSVVCANGMILASAGNSIIKIKPDLSNPVASMMVISSATSIKSLIWSNNKFWAIKDGASLISSDDGENWTDNGTMGTATNMNALYIR